MAIQSVFEGDKFQLGSGDIVEVIAYHTSRNILVEYTSGRTATTTLARLRKGSFAQGFEPADSDRWVDIGDRFTLTCGTRVEVSAFGAPGLVIVRNQDYEEHCVDRVKLVKGQLRWPTSTDKISVGMTHKSKKHGSFQIERVLNKNNITVRWKNTGYEQRGCTSFDILNGNIVDDSFVPEIAIDVNNLLPTEHYVYCAILDDEYIYIGKGSGLRYLHVTSGKSNNYDLNQLHFSGITPTVKILANNLNHNSARAEEERLIKLHQPKYNKHHTSNIH